MDDVATIKRGSRSEREVPDDDSEHMLVRVVPKVLQLQRVGLQHGEQRLRVLVWGVVQRRGVRDHGDADVDALMAPPRTRVATTGDALKRSASERSVSDAGCIVLPPLITPRTKWSIFEDMNSRAC